MRWSSIAFVVASNDILILYYKKIKNSSNIKLERELKTKYDNIEGVLSKNIGMGAGNNIGLKRCKTEYAYVLNPDTKLNNETIHNLLKSLNKIKDFTLASAINDNPKIPNPGYTCQNTTPRMPIPNYQS